MGVSRLRVFGALACMLALFAFVAFAHTVAELEGIAANELVPAISAAAGAALAVDYAGKTEAYLLDLAANGRTIGLRTAGSNALSAIYVKPVLEVFSMTLAKVQTPSVKALEDRMTAIANGTGPEMVRASAIDALKQIFIGEVSKAMRNTASLKTLASDMTKTHEFRLAAAKAYYFMSKGTASVVSIKVLENTAAKYASDELAYAAGELLGDLYVGFFPKTQAEYEALAKSGATLVLRVAGQVGLKPFLYDKPVVTLETKILDLLNIFPEYRQAYQDALAYQYGL